MELLWNDMVFFGCWVAACCTLYCIFDNWGMFSNEEKEHKKAQRYLYWQHLDAAAKDKIRDERRP